MKTMKKFWKYFLNFVVLFLLVTGFTCWGTINNNKNEKVIECLTQTESPVIEITECTQDYIKGTVKNDTKVLLNVVYVKAEFYNENEKLLGTKYSEIKYFNVGEKAKFEIENTYKDVATVKVTCVETKS